MPILEGCQFVIPVDHPTDYDELIGQRTLKFTAEELAEAMPNVNDTVDETISLGPCNDDRDMICSEGFLSPTGPLYTFTYRITRLPDPIAPPIA